jgi:hypothetical protein
MQREGDQGESLAGHHGCCCLTFTTEQSLRPLPGQCREDAERTWWRWPLRFQKCCIVVSVTTYGCHMWNEDKRSRRPAVTPTRLGRRRGTCPRWNAEAGAPARAHSTSRRGWASDCGGGGGRCSGLEHKNQASCGPWNPGRGGGRAPGTTAHCIIGRRLPGEREEVRAQQVTVVDECAPRSTDAARRGDAAWREAAEHRREHVVGEHPRWALLVLAAGSSIFPSMCRRRLRCYGYD